MPTHTPTNRPCYLIVLDDETTSAQKLYQHLAKILGPGLRWHHGRDADDGIQQLNTTETDPVLVALTPKAHGAGPHWIKRIRASGYNGPLIVLAPLAQTDVTAALIRAGADDTIDDPQPSADMLRRAMDLARARYEARLATQQSQGLQQELRTANRILKSKNAHLAQRYQDAHRFVDYAAHEFQTPLTLIREFATMIEDGLGGPVTTTQAGYLQVVAAATVDLAQLVDDLVESTKLGAGCLRVDRRPCTVAKMMDMARSAITARATTKGIRLVEEVAQDLGPVFADPQHASRALINLSFHAIKRSPADGAIKLWADLTQEGGCTIGVTDFGPALSTQEEAALAQRFGHTGDVRRAATKGFGLGLNVARELAWLNLSTVRIGRDPGEGNSIGFVLAPCQPAIILDHYLQRLANIDEPPPAMTVLRVRPTDPTADLDEVRRFVAWTCHPMDLVFEHRHDPAVLVVGSTAEPDRWIDRLRLARAATMHAAIDHRLPPLEMCCLGSWPYPQRQTGATCCVLHQLSDARAGLAECHDQCSRPCD